MSSVRRAGRKLPLLNTQLQQLPRRSAHREKETGTHGPRVSTRMAPDTHTGKRMSWFAPTHCPWLPGQERRKKAEALFPWWQLRQRTAHRRGRPRMACTSWDRLESHTFHCCRLLASKKCHVALGGFSHTSLPPTKVPTTTTMNVCHCGIIISLCTPQTYTGLWTGVSTTCPGMFVDRRLHFGMTNLLHNIMKRGIGRNVHGRKI